MHILIDEDLIIWYSLIRYIHQNPVKAGIVHSIEEYKWSSYNDYIKLSDKLTDIEFALDMLSENRNEANALFKELHETTEEIDFSISNTKRLSDEQLRRKIYTLTKIQAYEIAIKPKTERNQILKTLRKNGLTTGQLERLTGISRGIISRV